MELTFSDTSPLPLQLQIESKVRGTQKLAYLPTSGPSLDFYYLNYRPTYIAGQSTIDFWMISPKGIQAPKTASLELFDEFGKIKLATLVKEGTEIPQGKKEVENGEPFLWKSWVVPKELKADFEFSDKFRVVLRTSDAAPSVAPAAVSLGGKGKRVMNKKVVKNDKRSILNKIFKRAAAATTQVKKASAKNTKTTANAPSVVVVQDRQFRIKGLQATPGGKANPAKLHVNSVAPAPDANSGANAKVKTANPKDVSTPAPANNKDTTASPAVPVIQPVEGKKSSAVSSLNDINLSVSVIVTFTVTLLTFLGLLL
ncbi:hypothetical protein BGZ96_007387 [Linnemannia gamsii]|uniref:Uncharacterized protein n=1 Tax=Linnemannia gamsii TaxID=64522 RepID=A0ABQ7KEE2_9FUNG|nr:hypothetical protein BGZ96_007387 [Linnemannia gamsii]